VGHSAPMAKRPSSPAELREAVERTVQATLGSAERQRERTQGAFDDLAGTVDQLRKGAGAGIARGRRAIEDRRPATSEDIRELKAELRRIGRRLDAIEERLPAKRAPAKRAPAKRSGGGAKRSPSGGSRAS
jgi:chromosome segregation ATPase